MKIQKRIPEPESAFSIMLGVQSGPLRGRELALRVSAPNRGQEAFAPCGARSLCSASRPRIAARKLSLLAGPGACCTCPSPESRPGSFRSLRGQSHDIRAPAPNRGQEAFAPCGASRMISAPRPRIAAMSVRPLAGPGACCTRPGPESRAGTGRKSI